MSSYFINEYLTIIVYFSPNKRAKILPKFVKYSTFLIIIILSACTSKKSVLKKCDLHYNADSLAIEVQKATGQDCWDEAQIVKWQFGKRIHTWDRVNDLHAVTRKDITAVYNLDNRQKAVSFKINEKLTGKKHNKAIADAYQWWKNDSFWLNPFAKFMEKGVWRYFYVDKKGYNHLVICYKRKMKSGRAYKAGDMFDWKLNKNNLPISWNLFVKIVPVKNYKMSWESWITLNCGLKVSRFHRSRFFNTKLQNISVNDTIRDSRFDLLKVE